MWSIALFRPAVGYSQATRHMGMSQYQSNTPTTVCKATTFCSLAIQIFRQVTDVFYTADEHRKVQSA